ncbi:hypothetical protein PT974_01927 [Cladobotryum mycophilum]|uniref:Uncharacterized protein n=1 Tax=Cladobotryum mycophilum TaxID=491253 RepID=A0ABR0SXS4_9HYPO
MFVHSGASLHGHELQDQQPSPPPHSRRFPFLRTALRPLSTESMTGGTSPTSPIDDLPGRPLSVAEPLRRSSLINRRRTTSDSVRPKDVTVRFREPQLGDIVSSTVPSEDEESLVGSEISDQTDVSSRQKKRKRAPRKSTRFALGYPAPQLRTKQRTFLQIRPRVLLQLQELGEKRAMPAFDVVPSSLIAGSLIIPKLNKRFPRMFRAKPCLGQNDLLLVRSEHYSPSSPSSSPIPSDDAEKNLDDRDVLAVVSTTTEQDDNFVEIVFQDGSTWTTSLMANGSYEFTHVNDQGEIVKARWVKRALTSPRASWASANAVSPSPSPPPPEHKWTFSIIDPTTRRHPIQGILTSTTLDIFDTYSTMSTSSGRYPPTRSFGSDTNSSPDQSPVPSNSTEERATMNVPEENKTLMLATAIWISLRQKGWPGSASPRLPRVMSYRSISNGNAGRAQTFPMSCGSSGASTPTTPHARSFPLDTSSAHSHQGMIRRAVSSGGEFMRRRREASGMMELEEVSEKQKTKVKVEDDTPTCRLKVRRFTYKLFHPRSQRVS